MKITCEACGTILVDPPLTTKKINCMDIINYEKEYILEKGYLLKKFFNKYSEEINKLKDIENEIIKKHNERLKSINEEKHKVADIFDKNIIDDFEQWKKK